MLNKKATSPRLVEKKKIELPPIECLFSVIKILNGKPRKVVSLI